MLDRILKYPLGGYNLRILFLVALASLLAGCNSNSDTSEYSQAGIEKKAYTEDEFLHGDVQSISPLDSIAIVFLEPETDTEQVNDSSGKGIDVIPYTYPQKVQHTFCWHDEDDTADHYMNLQDQNGMEILRVFANGDCATEDIEAGDYNAYFYHDNRTAATFPVFMIPDAYVPGPGSGKSSSSGALTTIIQTNGCRECDLTLTNFSNRNLDDVDLTNADLTFAFLENTSLVDAKLVNANFTEASIYPSTDLTGADISGARFTRSYPDPRFYYQQAEAQALPAGEITGTELLAAARKWNYVFGCSYAQQNHTFDMQLILNLYDSEDSEDESATPLGRFSITVTNDDTFQTETFERLAGPIQASQLAVSVEKYSSGEMIETETLERNDELLSIRYRVPENPESRFDNPIRHIRISDLDVLYVDRLRAGLDWEINAEIIAGAAYPSIIFASIDRPETFRMEEIAPSPDVAKTLKEHVLAYLSALFEDNQSPIKPLVSYSVSYKYELSPSGLETYLPVTYISPHQADPATAEQLSNSMRSWWADNYPPAGAFVIDTRIYDPISSNPILLLRNVTLESGNISDLN